MKFNKLFLSSIFFLFVITLVTAQSKSQPLSKADNPTTRVADTGCTGQDTFDQGVKIVPNANSWTDSYQANDFCFCKSSFDHGVGNFKININGQGRNIRAICDELKKHPKFRNFRNGDARYNTIQCGNAPGHGDAITIQGKRIKDEKVCPGRVDQGSKGCKCKGPKFDMNWLKTRARFGGNGGGNNGGGNNGGGNNGGGNNSGGSVTIKGQSLNKFLSTNMVFNSNNAGNQQKFSVQSAGGGTVSIKASNGKFVSSENGNKGMTANRGAVGAWEKFTLVSQGGDVYAIKGSNGKYVSHQNGNGAAKCNRGSIQGWEKFIIKGLNRSSRANDLKNSDKLSTERISIYPNPAPKDNFSLTIHAEKDIHSSVEIIDMHGRSIAKQNLGLLEAGTNTIPLSGLRNSIDGSGLYLVRVILDNKKTIVKKMLIE